MTYTKCCEQNRKGVPYRTICRPTNVFYVKVVNFWDILQCSPYMDQRASCFLARLLSILKREVIYSSETSVHIRTAQRYIPQDCKLP
jgi:hypothetical protein